MSMLAFNNNAAAKRTRHTGHGTTASALTQPHLRAPHPTLPLRSQLPLPPTAGAAASHPQELPLNQSCAVTSRSTSVSMTNAARKKIRLTGNGTTASAQSPLLQPSPFHLQLQHQMVTAGMLASLSSMLPLRLLFAATIKSAIAFTLAAHPILMRHTGIGTTASAHQQPPPLSLSSLP